MCLGILHHQKDEIMKNNLGFNDILKVNTMHLICSIVRVALISGNCSYKNCGFGSGLNWLDVYSIYMSTCKRAEPCQAFLTG